MTITQQQASSQGDIQVPAGELIDLGTTGLTLSGGTPTVPKHLRKVGTGANPILKFRGGAQSAALTISRNAFWVVENIDQDILPDSYLFFSRGGVRATGCHALNGGGLIGLRSASGENILNDCHTPHVGYYGVLTGAELPTRDGSGNPIYLLSKSLQLLYCSLKCDLTTHQHGVRNHALAYLKILGGRYEGPLDPAAHSAILRAHDVGKVDISSTFIGKNDFGPLAGGDGGINIDVRKIQLDASGKPVIDPVTKQPVRINGTIDPNFAGDKRYMAGLRLGELNVSSTQFIGDVRLEAGLVKGRFADTSIDTRWFSAVVTAQPDYMGRGLPHADFVRTKFLLAGNPKNGVPIGGLNPFTRYGPACSYQGKPLPVNPSVAA